MDGPRFRMLLYLPAQAATETEATILEWRVAEGGAFRKGDPLAEVDSAKSVFDFEAPCDGKVLRLLRPAGATVELAEPVLEIETDDPAMRDWIPPAAGANRPDARPVPAGPDFAATDAADASDATGAARPGSEQHSAALAAAAAARHPDAAVPATVVLRGLGGYLPERVVTNAELVRQLPGISEEYVYQVTGIRQRRWAADGEKPSDMALAASERAIRSAGLRAEEIDAVIVATTTPDVAMPSTACILQSRLGLYRVPAFDLNAACSGWLYAVAMGQGMIFTGTARNVLAVGVDLQSRLLDLADASSCLIFGDGAGAAVVSAAGPNGGAERPGRRLRQVVLGTDVRGLDLARRHQPGYYNPGPATPIDPWIRLDGPALFRSAAECFADLVLQTLDRSGWKAEEVRWVVPHQANARILRAAAKRCGMPFERFFLNVDRIGNTSSASIALALLDLERGLQPGDKLVLCSVGAGLTTAAAALEW
jgi:3-oxoacyl-(acyl-carrier-protein) synthase III